MGPLYYLTRVISIYKTVYKRNSKLVHFKELFKRKEKDKGYVEESEEMILSYVGINVTVEKYGFSR